MPKRKESKKRHAQDVTHIIESHQEAVADERRKKTIEAASSLFEVDTVGSLSRRQEKRVKALVKGHSKTDAQLEKERKWVAAREDSIARDKSKRKLEESVFDLWGDGDSVRKPSNKVRAVSDPKKRDIPKVIIADPGQSINPSETHWKAFLVSLAARVKKEKEDHHLLAEALEPITCELTHIFPKKIIETLSTNQKLALFRIAKDSVEMLEEPEDFLARVLPTLVEAPAGDPKDEAVLDEIDSAPTMAIKPLPKTRKDRNRELRRKIHEAKVQAHADAKAKRRELERLGDIFQEVQTEESKREARQAYRKALEEYWVEASRRGEVKPFRIGKNTFEEPLDTVASHTDLQVQEGSMRKLQLAPERSALRDRLGSIQRRGLVELPSLLTGAKYRQMRSRFGRVRNHKKKVASKHSWQPPAK